MLFEDPSLICLSVGFLSLILNLIALPFSPTSPPPTQAPLVAPVLPVAGLIMHRHVLIALLRFHLPTLADTMLRFSQYISTYSNGALSPPRVVASAVASVGVETVVPPLPTSPAVYPIICLRRAIEKHDHRACTARMHTPATRSATATATAIPITFTSTTANAAATVRYLTIDRSMGMKSAPTIRYTI